MHNRVWGIGVLAGVAAAALAGAVPAASASASAPGSLQPPPVTVLTDKAGTGGGDFFISPFGDASTYANGAEILSPNGKKVVWFHPAPTGAEVADFRKQTYEGKPVLTFWQGTGLGGVSTGADYIDNSDYEKIATVQAGNGYSADGHEFVITPCNTALVLAYTTATANLTSIGGPANQTVIDGIVQEIDIRTGKVLFQWRSADHVPYSQSEQPLPASASTPWDWFHVNAVKLDTDGNLLVDARNTWTTYKVSRHTGQILWQLGGKASSFTEQAAPGQVLNSAGKIFAWQHDPEPLGHGVYTFFDNESAGTANRVRRHHRAALQPGRHGAAERPDPPGDAAAFGQSAGAAQRPVAGRWPDAPGRRPARRVGLAALLLRVRPVRHAAVQRRVPHRREHLPRLSLRLETRPPLTARSSRRAGRRTRVRRPAPWAARPAAPSSDIQVKQGLCSRAAGS